MNSSYATFDDGKGISKTDTTLLLPTQTTPAVDTQEEIFKVRFRMYWVGLLLSMAMMGLSAYLLFTQESTLSQTWKWTYVIFWSTAGLIPLLGLIAACRRSLTLTKYVFGMMIILEAAAIPMTVFSLNICNIMLIVLLAYLIIETFMIMTYYKKKEKQLPA
mmetsp:Transcript_37949/g.44238  ORF Transcript_37949/g.44238 Transcript_37949/m.44238 type:complete len:161 (+) Transcript_37949:2-484(+)